MRRYVSRKSGGQSNAVLYIVIFWDGISATEGNTTRMSLKHEVRDQISSNRTATTVCEEIKLWDESDGAHQIDTILTIIEMIISLIISIITVKDESFSNAPGSVQEPTSPSNRKRQQVTTKANSNSTWPKCYERLIRLSQSVTLKRWENNWEQKVRISWWKIFQHHRPGIQLHPSEHGTTGGLRTRMNEAHKSHRQKDND